MSKKCLCPKVLLVLFLPLYTLSEGMNLPAGLPVVEEETFAMDPAIKSVTIDEGTAAIGPRAFSGCTGLSEITLPASLESIDETAFEGCGQLSAVYVTPHTWACQWAMSRGYTVFHGSG